MTTFVAGNALEKKLIQAQNGEIEGPEFLKEMLDLQVFMPVKDKYGIAGLQDSKEAIPLSLKDDEGTERVVIFTSPERGKEFVKDYPGYEGGLLEDFRWVIERIGGGYGVILNPGLDIGLELEANMLEALSNQ
jgi:hypothetical protein